MELQCHTPDLLKPFLQTVATENKPIYYTFRYWGQITAFFFSIKNAQRKITETNAF